MSKRTHVVMVPGFGGFDALGSIRYYEGITRIFHEWEGGDGGRGATLHYFDNLPTASVSARARELRAFLAKRIARGEIREKDEVCLVGHSTGGLDIRQLVDDLQEEGSDAIDGDADTGREITRSEILACIRRVVFLSVPHRGTNIADCVKAIGTPTVRAWVLACLRNGFVSWSVQRLASPLLHDDPPADLLRALDRVRREIEPRVDRNENEAAKARHTAADISLWYDNTRLDLLALDDLASSRTRADRLVERAVAEDPKELASWRSIETRSYATITTCPFDPKDIPGHVGPVRSLWELGHLTRARAPQTDGVFRMAYAACSAGPFEASSFARPEWLVPPDDGSADDHPIERWDNDGIVNTASMFWPPGAPTRLVHGDHGDVIGHFGMPGRARARTSSRYDLLRSGSNFAEDKLARVWGDVFDFAVR